MAVDSILMVRSSAACSLVQAVSATINDMPMKGRKRKRKLAENDPSCILSIACDGNKAIASAATDWNGQALQKRSGSLWASRSNLSPRRTIMGSGTKYRNEPGLGQNCSDRDRPQAAS